MRTRLLPLLLAGLAGWVAFCPPAYAGKRARSQTAARAAKSAARTPKSSTKITAPRPHAVPSQSRGDEAGETAAPTKSEMRSEGKAEGAAAEGNTENKTEPANAPGAPGTAKARVYTFSGLDVNGNLRAPQLLFFRGRVKQELDTSSPEKRSFLKELEGTADAKGL